MQKQLGPNGSPFPQKNCRCEQPPPGYHTFLPRGLSGEPPALLKTQGAFPKRVQKNPVLFRTREFPPTFKARKCVFKKPAVSPFLGETPGVTRFRLVSFPPSGGFPGFTEPGFRKPHAFLKTPVGDPLFQWGAVNKGSGPFYPSIRYLTRPPGCAGKRCP